ncbi:MAG: tetratricopeptide repeat protein [Planctomycetota bacterium]
MIKNVGIALVVITVAAGLYAQTAGEPDKSPLTPEQEANQKKTAEYRQKLADNPNDIELHRSYQNFMRQLGGLNDLKEEYLLKLNAAPQNPVLYYLYGRLTEGKELEDSFKRVLELEAKTPSPELRFWVYFGFGQYYLDAKKYKEALQYLEMASKLRPDSLDVLHQMALVHYETDNITEAMKIWDNILEVKSDYLDAMLGKALIYKSRGMYDNAITELENILKTDVTFWRAYEPLIQCCHAKQDYKKGEELRNKIREPALKNANFKISILTIDAVKLDKKIIVAEENIKYEPFSTATKPPYLMYKFRVYLKSINDTPDIIYEIYDKGCRCENRLLIIRKETLNGTTKEKTIKDEAPIHPYSELLNLIKSLEK